MNSNVRHPLSAALVVVGFLLASSTSWACVPQARLVFLEPRSSGPSGSEITVSGVGFDPTDIEIRWNTSDGERLASATGPDFSAQVTIPTVEPGLYGVIVLSRLSDGRLGNAGRAAFQVTESTEDKDSATNTLTSPPTVAPPIEEATASPDRSFLSIALVLVLVGALLGVGACRYLWPRACVSRETSASRDE